MATPDRALPRRKGGRSARLQAQEVRPADPFSDDALTSEGLHAPRRRARLLVLACGALAREIGALCRLNGWDEVTLHCLPAILHNRPERIGPAAEAALDAHPHDRAFLAYADCGTGGGLERLAARRGIGMLPGAHCYAFFDGVAAFEARGETTAFYLTDFLARQFDAFVTRPLGLDRHPELRDTYFRGYDRLVHLAQVEDLATEALARRHADTLGLAFERRLTGYGDLAAALEREVAAGRAA